MGNPARRGPRSSLFTDKKARNRKPSEGLFLHALVEQASVRRHYMDS